MSSTQLSLFRQNLLAIHSNAKWHSLCCLHLPSSRPEGLPWNARLVFQVRTTPPVAPCVNLGEPPTSCKIKWEECLSPSILSSKVAFKTSAKINGSGNGRKILDQMISRASLPFLTASLLVSGSLLGSKASYTQAGHRCPASACMPLCGVPPTGLCGASNIFSKSMSMASDMLHYPANLPTPMESKTVHKAGRESRSHKTSLFGSKSHWSKMNGLSALFRRHCNGSSTTQHKAWPIPSAI